MSNRYELVVVGGGPAGVAAALMADSLGTRTCLLFAEEDVGGAVPWIGRIANLPGCLNGEDYARVLRQQVRGSEVHLRANQRAAAVAYHNDEYTVTLEGGGCVISDAVIWATGRRPISLAEDARIQWVPALDVPEHYAARPDLKAIGAAERVAVIGADRALGTLLRSLPGISDRMVLIYRTQEAYMLAELSEDLPKLQLVEAPSQEIRVSGGSVFIGERLLCESALVLTNLGSIADLRPLHGFVIRDKAGNVLHASPGLYVAGDAAHVSHQRIAVALGDGARAALTHYYRREQLYGFT